MPSANTLGSSQPDPLRPPETARDAESAGPEEIYTPIEADIDRDAERAVCAGCGPDGEKKSIVSVNGEDVDASTLFEQDGKRAA